MRRKASAVIPLAFVISTSSRTAALGAVVLMVRVVLLAWPGVAVRFAGAKLQVLSAGRPEHAKVTEPERPALAVTVSCAFTVCPRVTLREAGLELMELYRRLRQSADPAVKAVIRRRIDSLLAADGRAEPDFRLPLRNGKSLQSGAD